MVITRRSFLVSSSALIAAPRLIKAADREFFVLGFGGQYQDGQSTALFSPFERETGIHVRQSHGNIDLDTLRLQVKSRSVQWDLLTLPDRLLITAAKEGLLQKLNYDIIDKKEIPSRYVSDYWVGSVVLPMLLSYSTIAYNNKTMPLNWKQFWDTKNFVGLRGFYDGPTYSLEFALLADGVPKDKLYPLDVNRAFKSLDKLKSSVRSWWRDFSTPAWLLETGRVTVTPWTRTLSSIRQGHPLGFSYDGAALTYEAWAIPAGARNTEAATRFIAWAIGAQQQAALTNYILFGPTNANAYQFIDKDINKLLPTNPVNLEKAFFVDGAYWGKNIVDLQQRWQEWRLS